MASGNRSARGGNAASAGRRADGGSKGARPGGRRPDGGARVVRATGERMDGGVRVARAGSGGPSGVRVARAGSGGPDGARVARAGSGGPDGARVAQAAGKRPEEGSQGSQTGQIYIHGNVARQVEEDPRRREGRDERIREEKRRRVNAQVRRNQQKALRMDLPYLVMLVAASCCTLFICINYLHVQTTMTRRMDRIKKLEKEVDFLRAENDTLQTRINTSVDLDRVYKVATEELGMVYAGKSQVRMFHQTESEFVRQYEDIPAY